MIKMIKKRDEIITDVSMVENKVPAIEWILNPITKCYIRKNGTLYKSLLKKNPQLNNALSITDTSENITKINKKKFLQKQHDYNRMSSFLYMKKSNKEFNKNYK
jgi:hypothetical protein